MMRIRYPTFPGTRGGGQTIDYSLERSTKILRPAIFNA